MSPTFSIITVNYNDADCLHATLESIAAQTCSDYELIVVDGYSQDASLKVIEDFDDLIDRWVSKPDKGIYDAMNKGVGMARGEYVNFMNAGDHFYKPGVLQEASDFIEAHKPDLFYGKSYARGTRKFLAHKPELWMGMVCTHQAAFSKRRLHLEYPYSDEYRISADYRFFVQCVANGFPLIATDIDVATIDIGGLSRVQSEDRILERLRICHEFHRTAEVYRYNREFAERNGIALPDWAATEEAWLHGSR